MVSTVIPVQPFDLVIFGGTGDLALRKLLPALYHRDLNMHAYAAELGVSVSTVSRRHARLLRKLGTLMPDATGPP